MTRVRIMNAQDEVDGSGSGSGDYGDDDGNYIDSDIGIDDR